MDDSTSPDFDADPDARSSQQRLLDEVWDALEDRTPAPHSEAVARAEPAARNEAHHRSAKLEQSHLWDSADGGLDVLDGPVAFEAPALTPFIY